MSLLQQTFDTVVNHLREQGRPAYITHDSSEPSCAYRGEGGTKCAVGCLIPDHKYSVGLEGMPARLLPSDVLALPDGRSLVSLDSIARRQLLELLNVLQTIHDFWAVAINSGDAAQKAGDQMESALRNLAEAERLTYTPPTPTEGSPA